MTPSETLYALVPAIYQIRDARVGEPLRALLAVLQEELDRVDDQIARTYENWFIETCEPWVVPYLGDALGVRGMQPLGDSDGSLRAYVANTLGFRQRKGTASVLEDLVVATTRWPAAAVEMFQRLAATEHADHIVMSRVRTPDLRDGNALELLGGPFETANHFVDVRSIAQNRGRYNIPEIAIWVWRLEAFVGEESPAVADLTAGPGRLRFSPLGNDLALYSPARGDDLSPQRTASSDVPAPLRRRPVWVELEAARSALAAGDVPAYVYLDAAEPAFRVWEVDSAGVATEIARDQIQVCNLSAWQTGLPAARSYVDPRTGGTVAARVAVDPVLGRLAYFVNPPATTRVSFRYGFPGELGGGLYERELSAVGDRAHYAVGPGQTYTTLAAAMAAWTTAPSDAVFELVGNGDFSVADLTVTADFSIEIRSSDEARAVIRLTAPWQLTLGESAALTLDGLLVVGNQLRLATSGEESERRVSLRHVTLVPGNALTTDGSPLQPSAPSITIDPAAVGRLLVAIDRTIAGPIDLGDVGELTLSDSIVDAMQGPTAAVHATALTVTGSTILGKTEATTLDATDAIFDDVVSVERVQTGCLRFSYVAPGSRTPHGYRCQPALALEGAAAADHDDIVQRIRPRYTAHDFRSAAYAQLHEQAAAEVTSGASDGSEMGAWHFLYQPQREANLATVLDEYTRFGLSVGVFKAT